jgi:predicted protein tyrosine phosphatase
MTTRQNALWNCKNPYQGKYKRVLTICSAGLLRSPTIAWYIQSVSDYNCRAAGMHDYALVHVDDVLVEWADLIICTDEDKYITLMNQYEDRIGDKPVLNFNIPDIYEYKNPDLIKIIEEQCIRHGVFDAES